MFRVTVSTKQMILNSVRFTVRGAVALCLGMGWWGNHAWGFLPQARGVYAVPPSTQREIGFSPQQSAGVFIGVNHFGSGRTGPAPFADIPFAVDDAVDLAYLFSHELGLVPAEKMVLFLSGEPVKAETRKKLDWLSGAGASRFEALLTRIWEAAQSRVIDSGREGLVVLGAATHGFQMDGKSFLVVKDTLKDRKTTAISVKELLETVLAAPASRKIAFLDSCKERVAKGGRNTGSTEVSQALNDALAKVQGMVTFSAAPPGGYAFDDPEVQKRGFYPCGNRGSQGRGFPCRWVFHHRRKS